MQPNVGLLHGCQFSCCLYLVASHLNFGTVVFVTCDDATRGNEREQKRKDFFSLFVEAIHDEQRAGTTARPNATAL